MRTINYDNQTAMKTTVITTALLAMASTVISAAADRGPPLGHHHPQANGSDKVTPLIPPINGHKNNSRPQGVYVSWPTDYSYRPPIWKIPPTAFVPNPKRDATATMTTTETTFRVVTTSTAPDTFSTPFNPRAGTS